MLRCLSFFHVALALSVFQAQGYVFHAAGWRPASSSSYYSRGKSSSATFQLQAVPNNVDMKEPKKECAALEPGMLARIQVGDVSLSRKAWKKRRRSGSPLLVPCSILDMDREDMVRWNVLYLVSKFGNDIKDIPPLQQAPPLLKQRGVALSFSDITKLYKKHLGTSLNKHAQALGCQSSRGLLRYLFTPEVQKEYGLRVVNEEEEESRAWLVLPISRHRARDMASRAGLVQFQAIDSEHNNDEQGPRMGHTGKIRVKHKNDDGAPSFTYLPLSAALRVSQRDVDEGRVENGSIHEAVVFSYDTTGDGGSPLLTMALNTQQISHCLKQLKSVQRSTNASSAVTTPALPIKRELKELQVGDGPFAARVVSVSGKIGAAFVDASVGRQQGKQHGGGVTRVLGMLRFKDVVKRLSSTEMSNQEEQLLEQVLLEDDNEWEADEVAGTLHDLFNEDEEEDEEKEQEENGVHQMLQNEEDAATDEELKKLFAVFREELSDDEANSLEMALASEEKLQEVEATVSDQDITHLFSMNDDGISYHDPETGDIIVMDDEEVLEEEEGDKDEDEGDEFDAIATLSPEERLNAVAKLMLESDENEDEDDMDLTAEKASTAATRSSSHDPNHLKVGDIVDVYIKAVSKQSGRFMVTTDPSVKGRKAKDIKREQEAEKKLSRLAAKFGGYRGLEKIQSLAGTECEGIVKATSNTGDWYYVKPNLQNLPVGVAAPSEDTSSAIAQGDAVRVRLDGIDESRGQLAMTVLEKLP